MKKMFEAIPGYHFKISFYGLFEDIFGVEILKMATLFG